MNTLRFIIPTFFTVAALVAGFLSIIQSAEGAYLLAAQLIMLSMILDGFDGNLARLLKSTSSFGAEFDTFVDIISFGVAPAFLAYEVALKHIHFFGLVLASSMVLSGAMRLARFRVVDPHRGGRGYLGLPITANAGWIALWVFISQSGVIDESYYSVTHGPTALLVWTVSTAFVILQMSHLHYPKPTKDLIFFLPGVLMVLMLFTKMHVAVASALAMCVYGLFYGFVTPFLPRPEGITLMEEDDEEPVANRFRL